MTAYEQLEQALKATHRATEAVERLDPLAAMTAIRKANESFAEAMPELIEQARYPANGVSGPPFATWQQISDASGIPIGTIRRWMREAGGLEIRNEAGGAR